MSRELIYKDDARKAVLKENPSVAYCVDNVKVVDAVEVVRCIDCNAYDEGDWWCYAHSIHMPKNEFCSYGERKND